MHNPAEAVAAGRRLAGRQTQDELAAKLTELTGKKWTRDMVASLELGRKRFDIDVLMAVSQAQGLPVSFYLFGPGATAAGPNSVNPGYVKRRWLDFITPGQDALAATG